MGTVCIAIGGFFYALGLPLVLPYSGIEVIALATAFYVVLRAGQQREVIRIENDDVVVERGRKKIEERIARLPNLELASNALRGVGIPFCVHAGEQAAERILGRSN